MSKDGALPGASMARRKSSVSGTLTRRRSSSAGQLPRMSMTAPAELEVGVSPFHNVRLLNLATSLPPAVPHVWGGDPDAFRPPGFETISKPLRLSFMKTWHANYLGEAADVIPDVMPASNWLPPGVKHQVKLGGKFKYEQDAKKKAEQAAAELEAKKAAERGSSKKKGKDSKKDGKKGKGKAGSKDPPKQDTTPTGPPKQSKELPAADVDLDAAALAIQCLARQRFAKKTAKQQLIAVQRNRASSRIGSAYRGRLARTGRAEVTPKIDVEAVVAKAEKAKKKKKKRSLPMPVMPVQTIAEEETPRDLRELVLPCIASRVKYLDPDLQDLDLRYCCLGKFGAPRITEIISQLHSLQSLELMGNYIGSKGLRLVVEVLEPQKDLKVVNLAWNGIGDDGCEFLASLLESHELIEKLDLQHNRIGDLGCAILANAMKGHRSLKRVDLRDNSVLDSGAEHILAVCNKKLSVNMQNNPIPAAKLEELTVNAQTMQAESGNTKRRGSV
eukprot:CAMPEP_0197642530 /NCGR_PEP_ID=MMETSP1338-20131121/16163_1 /TAXON_ID=43686 ORGANISM="Pelagodinium beii, Strain RCC1491" /NCGR_SAMPLE_ID=MMETSP1338 /ASSEMBLY_ACC=CAM_ASM_000754 /LENGTH=500 /DNA_ID=CAMNT_0043215663 /DNA_START=91 /DNA_END=1590 /DNA_ORIENTATION=-